MKRIFKVNGYQFVVASDIRQAIGIYQDYETHRPGSLSASVTSIEEIGDNVITLGDVTAKDPNV